MTMPFDRTDEADEDARLLARYAAGDPDAAVEIARRHLPRILGFARRMLADPAEAEDVAQDAMLRLWRAAPGWQAGQARLSTWLWKVVSNLCTDRLRRRRSIAIDAIAEPADPAPGALGALLQAQRVAALEAALAQLPERQRQAVVLRHIEGLANPEIAEIMEIGVEAVESLTARGKRTLSGLLFGQREELGYRDAEIE
ncbi:MAG: RNA polymerase sigma factor [Gemmobacter sp.]